VFGTNSSTNMNRAINVGIIGAGYGLTNLLPVMESIPDYKVISLATKQRMNRKSINEALLSNKILITSPKNLIQNIDIDLVLIASPPSTHEEYAISAIEAGKNVYVEKPVGLNSDSTMKICQAANQYKKIHTVGYQFRFDPMINWLKNQILSDELGKIIRVDIQWETSGAFKTPKESWKNKMHYGGGVLRDFGSHVFDYLNYIEAINGSQTLREVEEFHDFKSNLSTKDIQDVNLSGQFGDVEFNCIISRRRTQPIGHLIRVFGTKGEARAHHRPPFRLEELTLEVINGNKFHKNLILDKLTISETIGFPLYQRDSRKFASSHLFFNLARAIRGESRISLPTLGDALFNQKLVDEAESVLF